MKYSEFKGLLDPVLNSRANSMLFTQAGIQSITNICIQQIYNEYRWDFQMKTISIPALLQVADGDKFKFTLIDAIKFNVEMSHTKYGDKKIINPAKGLQDFTEENFYTLGKDVFFKLNTDYLFTYFKQYEFLQYATDMAQEIPLPDKFIPALYFNVMSQIDLIYTQQLEGEPRASFNKYQYEIDKLKKDEPVAIIGFTGANPR